MSEDSFNTQRGIVEQLDAFKRWSERDPKNAIELPDIWKEINKLQRRMYYPNNSTEMHFYAQDKDGFPNEKIIHPEGAAPKRFVVARHKNYFKAKCWKGVPRPVNFTGRWPPQTSKDLLGDPPIGEFCAVCYTEEKCKCSYTRKFRKTVPPWHNFQIRQESRTGYGLYANADFHQDALLGEISGELKPLLSDEHNGEQYHLGIDIGPPVRSGEQPRCLIDVTDNASIFRFANHSCEPNARFYQARVGVDTRLMLVVASREIKKGDMICIDYGSDWFTGDDHCFCLAATCRNPPTVAFGAVSCS